MKNNKGSAEIVICLIVVLMVIAVMLAQLKKRELKTIKNYVDDGLTASLLAAALVDNDGYIHDDKVLVDITQSFSAFEKAFKNNFVLTDDFKTIDKTYLKNILINSFTIYNVENMNVYQYEYDQEGYIKGSITSLNDTYTPNNKKVEKTSLYCNITIEIPGIFDIENYVVVIEKYVGLEEIE